MGVYVSAKLVFGCELESFTEEVTKFDPDSGVPYPRQVDGGWRFTNGTDANRVRFVDADNSGMEALTRFGYDYGPQFVGLGFSTPYDNMVLKVDLTGQQVLVEKANRLLDEANAPVEGRGWFLVAVAE